MSYSTPDDLRRRLPEKALAQLTTETGDAPDDDLLAEVITEADAILDVAANTAGYATPVISESASTMGSMKSHSLSIAKFLLLDRRGLGAFDPAAETLYKAATAFTDRVAKGDLELSGADLKSVPAAAAGAVLAGSEDVVFGKGSRTSDPMRGL
jgi:phage gp36-like protein